MFFDAESIEIGTLKTPALLIDGGGDAFMGIINEFPCIYDSKCKDFK